MEGFAGNRFVNLNIGECKLRVWREIIVMRMEKTSAFISRMIADRFLSLVSGTFWPAMKKAEDGKDIWEIIWQFSSDLEGPEEQCFSKPSQPPTWNDFPLPWISALQDLAVLFIYLFVKIFKNATTVKYCCLIF